MMAEDDDERDAQHRFWGSVFGHVPSCPMNPRNDGKSGPAQVATPAYRRNYEAIFGRVPVGQA
jgi:hypothetical protein